MRILVTGASGFLGGHLCDELAEAGHAVRALVRPTSDVRRLEAAGVERMVASLETGGGLDAALEGVDAVVHAAGVVKARRPEDFHAVNEGGTRRLAEAARRVPGLRRFVLISSLEALGPSPDGRPRPDLPAEPVTHYGRSKRAAEELVLELAGLPGAVVRPTVIYGPGDRELLPVFRAVRRRLMARRAGPGSLTFVHARDCARAIRQVLEHPDGAGRIWTVDDGQTYGWPDFLLHLERALDVRALQLPLPAPVFHAAALAVEGWGKLRGRAVMLTRDKLHAVLAPHWVGDSGPLRDRLGWRAEVALADGLRTTAAWYRDQGWL